MVLYREPVYLRQAILAEIGMISEEVRSQKAVAASAVPAKPSKLSRTFRILFDPRLVQSRHGPQLQVRHRNGI